MKGYPFAIKVKYVGVVERFQHDWLQSILHPIAQRNQTSRTNLIDKINPTYYRNLIRKLIFFTHKRLEIAYNIHLVNKYMHILQEVHLQATKCILRCFKNITKLGPLYEKKNYKL